MFNTCAWNASPLMFSSYMENVWMSTLPVCAAHNAQLVVVRKEMPLQQCVMRSSCCLFFSLMVFILISSPLVFPLSFFAMMWLDGHYIFSRMLQCSTKTIQWAICWAILGKVRSHEFENQLNHYYDFSSFLKKKMLCKEHFLCIKSFWNTSTESFQIYRITELGHFWLTKNSRRKNYFHLHCCSAAS